MSSTTDLLHNLLDILFDEKQNISNENNYLKICKLCKEIGMNTTKDNYYDQYINELDNSNNYQEFNRKLLYERGRYMALLRKNNIDYSSVKKKYLKYHEKHLNISDS